jgi:hypothetical protein
MKNHDPGSGLQPRNSGLQGPHTYAQPFLTSNGTWPTSLSATPPAPLAHTGTRTKKRCSNNQTSSFTTRGLAVAKPD